MATGNNATIASASEALVERIKSHESAKTAYDVALARLRQTEEHLRAAHSAEVEAHATLTAELRSRRRTRRVHS